MKKSDLLKYLNDCKNLEVTYYFQCEEQQRLWQSMCNLGIQGRIDVPNRDIIARKVRDDIHNFFEDHGFGFIVVGIVAVIAIIVSLYIGISYDSIFAFIFFLVLLGMIIIPVSIALGLILLFICDIAVIPKIDKQYELAVSNYYMAVEQDKKRVEYEQSEIQLLQCRVNEIEAQKNETKSALDKLYAVGVVYEKYRALIPIVMFCEYLQSGRCSGLEGQDGAYNIYEYELRQNLIIYKLNEISSKLDQIQQNQYMLYTAINEGNQKLDRLCSAACDSAKCLQDIRKNNAIAAENSRVTAENTRILGEIETYKLLLK